VQVHGLAEIAQISLNDGIADFQTDFFDLLETLKYLDVTVLGGLVLTIKNYRGIAGSVGVEEQQIALERLESFCTYGK
jgi:hypothetical protein